MFTIASSPLLIRICRLALSHLSSTCVLLTSCIFCATLSAQPFADLPDWHKHSAWEELLEQGFDPDTAEVDGTTVLMQAIHERQPALASLLIDAGADFTTTNRYGLSALTLAARRGDTATTRLLLSKGADPNSANMDGETVLMTAAKNGNAELVKLLLESNSYFYSSGADPNAIEGWKGQTALMWAAALGHTEVVKVLIAGGADLNQRSSVINIAPVDPDYFQGGFVYTAIPKGRMTALHFAARQGQLESAKALIEAGADLNITDNEESSALILATLNGHLDIAGLLLENGADPNLSDKWGRTVLFVATDLNTLDANPRPAPALDDKLSPVDIIKLALAHGADPDSQLKRGLPGWVSVGGAHNPVLDLGATPFFRAAMSGDLTVMKILLEAGADPTLPTLEREGRGMGNAFRPSSGLTTPLMAAAGISWRQGVSRGREQDAITAIAMLLDEYDADINAANQAGDTALHGAVTRGSAAIIEYLVERGADLNAENFREWTPLDIALGQPGFAIEPNPEVAELLRRLMAQ